LGECTNACLAVSGNGLITSISFGNDYDHLPVAKG
jgi:hypothetical protein